MSENRAPGFIAKTLLLTRKDITTEARGRDTLPPMLAFSFVVALLLAFALPGSSKLVAPVRLPVGTAPLADVISGFLWITVLFAGLIGFARTFEVEREEGAIDALLLVPLDRSGLFAAKALANMVFVMLIEVVLLPAFALLFGLNLGARWAVLAIVVLLVDIGFVAIGTLFSSLAAQTRSRELVLPILALPALVPVFIAAVELTSELFLGKSPHAVYTKGWFALLAAFDVIFCVAGALGFEFVID